MSTNKKSNKWIYILAGIAVLLVAAFYFNNKSKPKGEEVEVETAGLRSITEIVSASGKVFPETEVKISSDVSGEVVALYVKEGDTVHVGQLLAKVNAEQYESAVERGIASVNTAKTQRSNADTGIKSALAQLKQAESQRDQIEAQLTNAKEIFKRNEQLYKEGVIAKADFDLSQSNLKGLEANLRASQASIDAAKNGVESARESSKGASFNITGAEASLRETKSSLRKTSIIAPTDGIVSKLNIEKGERVVGTLQMAGTEIMRLAQMNSMEVQVDVSENDVLRLNVGNPAEIEVDAYVGRKFKGVVSEIANSASNIGSMSGGVATNLSTDQVTNFVVKIRIDPKSYSDLITATRPVPFRPGMSASVDITTNVINSTLCVPIQAVTTRDGSETTDDSKKKKKDDEDKLMSEEEKKLQEAKKREIKEVVFVKSADTVRLAEVKTGIQDDSYIQILSGLNKGETVVIGPYNTVARKLKSGDKVVLKTDDKKKE